MRVKGVGVRPIGRSQSIDKRNKKGGIETASEVKHYPFYIGGVKQVYPNVHPGTPKYASTMVVDNLVFLSGMTAQDTETGACLTDIMADQMRVALEPLWKKWEAKWKIS